MNPKFLVGATVYYWVVWAIAKTTTTFGSFQFPELINRWYDYNSHVIGSIPRYGEMLRPLVRDNIADGTIAFWEIWFGLGLFLVVLRFPRWCFPLKKPIKPRGA